MSDDTNPGISTPETVTADLIDSIRKDIQDLDDLMYARDVRHDVMRSGLSSAMCTLTLLAQMLEDGLLVNRAMVTPRVTIYRSLRLLEDGTVERRAPGMTVVFDCDNMSQFNEED